MAYSELLISALKGTLEEIESNPSVSQRDGVTCLMPHSCSEDRNRKFLLS